MNPVEEEGEVEGPESKNIKREGGREGGMKMF